LATTFGGEQAGKNSVLYLWSGAGESQECLSFCIGLPVAAQANCGINWCRLRFYLQIVIKLHVRNGGDAN
jgi:hypothetical protein